MINVLITFQIFSHTYSSFQLASELLLLQVVRNVLKPADNLKKYKMKHTPKNNVILKTQDISQNKTKL